MFTLFVLLRVYFYSWLCIALFVAFAGVQVDAIGGTRFDDGEGGDNEVQRTMLEIVNQVCLRPSARSGYLNLSVHPLQYTCAPVCYSLTICLVAFLLFTAHAKSA